MNQVDRIIRILYWLSRGEELTSEDIARRFDQKVLLRDIQRDLARLDELQIGLCCDTERKPYVWYFPRGNRPIVPSFTNESELLSLYMLKAFLRTFDGTEVERSAAALLRKLESTAPGDVFWTHDHEILWDQNIGQFDYSGHSRTVTSVIGAIRSGKPVSVTYSALHGNTNRSFDAVLHRLFAFDGMLYVAAYVPYYANYIAMAVHRITEIADSSLKPDPKWQFDPERYTATRFGVFDGEPQHIKLRIPAPYRVYFENRRWHASQRTSEGPKGSMILEMDVPLAPDLVAWIAGWGEGIEVKAPRELRTMLAQHHTNALKQYV